MIEWLVVGAVTLLVWWMINKGFDRIIDYLNAQRPE